MNNTDAWNRTAPHIPVGHFHFRAPRVLGDRTAVDVVNDHFSQTRYDARLADGQDECAELPPISEGIFAPIQQVESYASSSRQEALLQRAILARQVNSQPHMVPENRLHYNLNDAAPHELSVQQRQPFQEITQPTLHRSVIQRYDFSSSSNDLAEYKHTALLTLARSGS